jgi:hypothetical protein
MPKPARPAAGRCYWIPGMPPSRSPARRFPGTGLLLGWGLGISSLAVACGGDGGVGDPASDAEPGQRCSAASSESIRVTSQAELNALEGCESLDGSVYIAPMSGSLDLRPLARLRRVGGQFLIGCNPLAGLEANCAGYSDTAVTSLEGLNALEEAGRLQLAQVYVTTLAPLTRLKRLGFLGIFASAGLTDLVGLEQLEALDGLELTNNADLRSLDGLPQLPGLGALVLDANAALVDIGALRGSMVTPRLVSVSGVPVDDLSALGSVESVTDFHLGDTRARNLDGLGLRSVNMLTISDNRLLEQVDALGALESFGSIILSHNAELTRLPEFRVSEFFGLSVSENPALTAGPGFPNLVRGRSSSITFERNGALTRLDGFRWLAVGGYISVTENRALRALDLSSLLQVDSLRVLCNPELPVEALAPLDGVTGDVTLPGDSADACLL